MLSSEQPACMEGCFHGRDQYLPPEKGKAFLSYLLCLPKVACTASLAVFFFLSCALALGAI